MTNRMPQTTQKKMLRALQKLGFGIMRIKGGHYILSDGVHETCVPFHSQELSRALMMKIIKQSNKNIEDFRPYL
ncbi:MAG TPA: type II toxin-antitoxin system HicA family toxin [Patescibacteria group bacterium]|nr:type II toxin-antitoxin system HicA family toxin [Patescibacteria group bacterium]